MRILDEVQQRRRLEELQAAGTSEGVRKAWETRKGGGGFAGAVKDTASRLAARTHGFSQYQGHANTFSHPSYGTVRFEGGGKWAHKGWFDKEETKGEGAKALHEHLTAYKNRPEKINWPTGGGNISHQQSRERTSDPQWESFRRGTQW